jgi:hypothetical protein
VLLWRGSRDGFGAEDFHGRCDGHANTLALILDTGENVSGGFTPLQWESRYGKWKCDESVKSFFHLEESTQHPGEEIRIEGRGEAVRNPEFLLAISGCSLVTMEQSASHRGSSSGFVTLKNLSMTDISMASCCTSLSYQMANFAEHSRFSSNEKDKNFEHYLPLFMKKRAEGLFCAHGASVEDRLLRQYGLTPGAVRSLPEQYSPKNIQKICVQKSISTQSPTSSPTTVASLKSISWGP